MIWFLQASCLLDSFNKVYGCRHVEEIHTEFKEIAAAYPIVHAAVLAKRVGMNEINIMKIIQGLKITICGVEPFQIKI